MTETPDLAPDDEAPSPTLEPATDDTPIIDDKTFADFDVAPELVAALAEKKIVHPFPIQALTLPMALDGHDIIGQARTGTGKTLAFGLPLLQRIDADAKYVQALVITPTRELTIQVATDLGIGKALGLHVTAIYGGVPIEPQTDALNAGAQVVVGTPGRLLDHVGRGNLDLSRCTQLVLDEADEMLDMGFLPDIERLVDAIGEGDRHTMLFSATMPAAIVSLARRYMDSPTFLRAAHDEPETAPTVDQYFLHVHRMDKPRVLARIMQTPERGGAFVFTRTKMMASRLVGDLEAMGIAAVEVHGDLRQASRERNLDKFRRGRADILVATEVAARGLDVDNVTHVVNYDCPDDHKMYLHRIGRTARAGAKGVAVTFCEYNEIDRVNVIRKSIDAHDGEDPVEVFSSSDLLTDWFDLPEETPWAAQRRKRRDGGESRDERGDDGRNRPSGRGDSSGSRDDDAARREGASRQGRSAGRTNSRGKAGARSGDSDRNSRGGGSSRADRADAPRARGSKDASRREETERTATDRHEADARKAPESTDPEVLETRTRTRTRVREDAARGPDRDRDASADRDRDADGGSDRPARKRARRPSDDGARDRARSGDEGGRDSSDSSGGRSSGGRSSGGGSSRSGSSGSSRSGSSRGGSSRSKGGSGSGSSRGTSSRTQSPSRSHDTGRSTRTSADRPTERGDDARGEGSPGLARRVLVEHLP